MLVTDGSFSGTKDARARELGTRRVTPEQYAVLLRHVQPAVEKAMQVARASRDYFVSDSCMVCVC